MPHPSVVDHPLAGKIAEALAATDPRTKTPEQVAAYSSQPIMMQLLSEIDSGMPKYLFYECQKVLVDCWFSDGAEMASK